jgi:hypothetical protein
MRPRSTSSNERLPEHDINVLGQGLARSFRVQGTIEFDDLLARLDRVEGSYPRNGDRVDS